VRRGLFYWQFVAVILLPTWVLVARGILGSSVGWTFLFFLVICPILGIGMLAIAGLTVARKGVRTERAVSWADAGVMAAWHAAIITYGFIDAPALAVAIVLVGITAFWVAVWQLFAETRTRVRGAMADFEQMTKPTVAGTRTAKETTVIILEPTQTRDKP
ncbi:MAG: MFS transporter, partial [Rhodoglobus sp.]|nr:MFS transporter [Rhodoglobus sp.]